MLDSKRCPKCKTVKPASDFAKSRSSKDGLWQWCRRCWSDYRRSKREAQVAAGLTDAPTDVRMEEFGESIRRARQERGWSQTRLADVLGVRFLAVRSWELGKSIPRQKTIVSIRDVLGIEPPLSVLRDKSNMFPVAVSQCDACGKDFPVYKVGVRCCSVKCSQAIRVASRNGIDPCEYIPGKIKSGHGYVKIKRPDHPNADTRGYIIEHRIVMEEKIGRLLRSDETVHHINGVKTDNRPENLELWVGSHPAGQRPEDIVAWAKEMLARYETM